MKLRGIQCSVEGCERRVISIKGRDKCREHHRLSVVWKKPNQQATSQCTGFREITKPRATQMCGTEAGSHIIALLKRCGELQVPAPVKRYFKCSVETAELYGRYAA